MRPLPPIAALRRTLAAALLATLLVPAIAHADFRELLRDACNDGRVNGTYSQADYRKALANIPADALQYTDCRDVLRAAQLAAARRGASRRAAGSPSGGGDGGPIARIARPKAAKAPAEPTARERSALQQAIRGDVQAAGPAIGAGTVEAASRPVASDLPTPLLVALALVVLGALVGLILYLLPRVRDRRSS